MRRQSILFFWNKDLQKGFIFSPRTLPSAKMRLICLKAFSLIFGITAVTITLTAGSHVEGHFDFIHHNHTATVEILRQVNKKCPEITRLYNLSETSVLGKELIVIEMTEEPGRHITSKFTNKDILTDVTLTGTVSESLKFNISSLEYNNRTEVTKWFVW